MKKVISLLLSCAVILSLSTILVSTANSASYITYNPSWEIEASTESGNEPVMNAFDGDETTFWHTYFTYMNGKVQEQAEYPHTVTVTFPEKINISGWRYTPRRDLVAGVMYSYEIYASADGKNFSLVYSGESGEYRGTNDASGFRAHEAFWDAVTAKAIKISITEGKGGHGTAAEIGFYTDKEGMETTGAESGNSASSGNGKYGKKIPFDKSWKIEASTESGNEPVANAFDGDDSTFWHTHFVYMNGKVQEQAEYPHTITVTFPNKRNISGLTYTPRRDLVAGVATKYQVYASEDGVNFELIFAGSANQYAGTNNASGFKPFTVSWGNTPAKAIRFAIMEGRGGHGTVAELEFYEDGEKLDISEKTIEFEGEEGKNAYKCVIANDNPGKSKKGYDFVSRKGFMVSVSSDQGESLPMMFDGDDSTYWHSYFNTNNGKVAEHETPPYYILAILPEATEISGISMLPRQDMAIGCFTKVNVYAAESDDGEWRLIMENEPCSGNMTLNEFHFNSNIKVKKIRVEVDSVGYGTLAEFNLIAKNDSLPTLSYGEFRINEAEKRLYRIDTSLFIPEYAGMDWGVCTHDLVFDGSVENFWQTVALPADEVVVLTVDMREEYEVSAIEVYPRETKDHHGAWLGVNVYASKDNENWDTVVEGATFEENLDIREFLFETPVTARYFEFEIYGYVAKRVSLGELYFYETKQAKDERAKKNTETYGLKIDSKEITYKLKGIEGVKEIDVAPFIINGSTMIPLRGLLELMGAEITWHGEDQSIDIDKGNYFIKLQIDNQLVYVKHPTYGDIRYTLLSIPVIVDGRTFIPLRFVSEQLGYNVSWNGETREITIESK